MEKIIKFSNHKQCFVFLGWNFPLGQPKKQCKSYKKNFWAKKWPKVTPYFEGKKLK
jgi:hypothetical protein